jgi:predicted transcriptional regulator of viral defense system
MRYVIPPRHQPILSDQAGCQNLSENRDESTFCRGREQIASTSLYYPSYLSFESALARHGILSQIPHTFTFATTRPSKTASVGTVDAEFSHLQPALYFGYTSINGLDVAEPEKALLDQLYLVSRGWRHLNTSELDLRAINGERLTRYAAVFPAPVGKLVQQLLPFLHTTPITNRDGERISW